MAKVTAVSMMRDEADIVEATLRHMAGQVDEIIVADNGSRDGTRDILSALERDLPLTVIDDPERAYLQSAKMTLLAHLAGGRGADWVVPFDADEIWYCNGVTVKERLEDIGVGMMVGEAELFDHVATGVDPDEPDPVKRIRFRRRQPLKLPKVACRYRPSLVIEQGNHGARYDGVIPAALPLLTVRHFPYRSTEQFLRKVRNGAEAYRAAGDKLPPDAGAHWRQWGQILETHGEEACADIFRRWFWRADPRQGLRIGDEVQPPLIFDPAPGS